MSDRSEPCIDKLRERARLLRSLRSFFDDKGFLEVQPPCLSRSCVVDPYIDPVCIDADQLRIPLDKPDRFYLQTSPELAMKRMLSAGAPSIYSIGPVFRSGEVGELHNVEFTMLEWYQVGADGSAAIGLLGDLAASTLSSDRCDVITYRQIFIDVLGIDPIDAPMETLSLLVAEIDRPMAEKIRNDRDAMLDVLLSEKIQATLGRKRPVIIKNYPLSQAALAKASDDDPQCAARFELFAGGIEVANGYDELTDPDELISRADRVNEKRIASGRQPLRAESKLVDAMRRGLPACAGVALGVDRLLMLQCGETTFQRVMPFRIGFA